jgi:FkbM family methyltransferase
MRMLPKGLALRDLEAKWSFLSAQEAFRVAPLRTILRLASWRIRCALRRAETIELKRWRVRMLLPPEWRGVAKLIYALRDYYEPELAYLERLLSPGKVFVDAGANFGIYTAMASKTVGERGRVISFEPSARAFPVLQHNIALNGFRNVLVFPAALTNKTGRAWLYHHPAVGSDALAKDSTFDSNAYAQRIATARLDNVLRQTSIERVDVIKMDVQGAEELALRGAAETITSMRPAIMFEFHPAGAVSLGLEPCGAWNLLKSLGYDFLGLGQAGTVARLTSPPATIANIVAIHGSEE